MKTLTFNPKILTFSEKVRLSCSSCRHYGKKASCPPYIESVEYYSKVLLTYKHGILILKQYQISNRQNDAIGRESSLDMYDTLNKLKIMLFNQGHYSSFILGGGSCKHCVECPVPNCSAPNKRIIPIEATGVDVVALVKKITNKTIKFPVDKSFYRIGVILYD